MSASVDPHRAKAATMYGIPEADVTPEQRQAAKLANYREWYGCDGWRYRRDDADQEIVDQLEQLR